MALLRNSQPFIREKETPGEQRGRHRSSELTPIFVGSTGLNNAVHPLRIEHDKQAGIMDLAAAVNVIIDETGMIQRRRGYELANSGEWHSLFCDGADCLGVRGEALCLIASDLSVTELRSGMEHRVDYAQVNQEIYYTSPSGFGIVSEGLHLDWEAQPYVGPDTNRSFVGPFAAEHIAFYAGRIWLSLDNFMAFSEPFGWSWFDLNKGTIPMDSKVRMMKPVDDGMFVSTNQKTYFLSGKAPEDFSATIVDNVPVLEYSEATQTLDGLDLGFDSPGAVAFWQTKDGPTLGTSSGAIMKLAKEKVIYPETAPVGASLVSRYNLVHTLGV